MELQLYNNKSQPNKVYKNKTLIDTLYGDVKEAVNIEAPSFTVPHFSGFNSVNYAYIPELGRYYFVSVEVLTGGLIKLSMKCDVISTFWDSFRNSPCIARRSSSAPDYRLIDNRVISLPNPEILYRRTNCALTLSTSNNYVLTVTGK